ncbi:hypothetical protein [Chlorogloea sp. CCALA 695]|uniref:hypothetical protein n=1 Tax=Chlorogloea sp. CCALA 695 TaxID=2107693 RepID=UPI0011B24907|nr:hypothetical protein [Chlorogloea sp. CCALA 695]
MSTTGFSTRRYANAYAFLAMEPFNSVDQHRVWILTLELGLVLWLGEYRGKNKQWLRWYDAAL